MFGLFRTRTPRLTGQGIETWIHENKINKEGQRAAYLEMSQEAEELLRYMIAERLDRGGSAFPQIGEFEGLELTTEGFPSSENGVALSWADEAGDVVCRLELISGG